MFFRAYESVLQSFAPGTRRASATALTILTAAAGFSVLIYWFGFSRPYNLLDLYQLPGFELYHQSQVVPAARWWLALAFAFQGGMYWAGWQVARRVQGRAAWAIVLGGALASGAVLLFMYPIGAADIFDYIMYARIRGIYGANPFYEVGRNFSLDPFFVYMGWKDLPSTYGPLWVLLSTEVARPAGPGVVANVLAMKLLSGAFGAGSVALAADILRRMAPERALAGTLLLAWNPLVLYETFGNGHNDIAMVFWVLAAVWLLVQRRYALMLLALVIGALFKFMPLLLLPAAGLIALRDLPDWRARLRLLLLAAPASVALVVVAYLPFWRDWTVLTVVQRRDLFTTSLPALLDAWLTPLWGAERAAGILSSAAAALTTMVALWEGFRAWRDRSWTSFARAGFHIFLFYLLFTCLWFQQWYTIWPLALAVLLEPGWAVAFAILFNFASLTKPLVFVPLWLWHAPLPPSTWVEQRLGPAVLALPWLAVLLALVLRARAELKSFRRERGDHAPANSN